MKLYVNKYSLQDFYGRYGYEYHDAEESGGDPYISDEEGNEIATAPHSEKDYFEGDDEQAMNKLADELKSQGVLTNIDGDDDGEEEDDTDNGEEYERADEGWHENYDGDGDGDDEEYGDDEEDDTDNGEEY